MKSFRLGAAAFIAASIAVLGGCAAEPPQAQKTADARDPCIGVAPPTGSLVRRKEDCGASRQDDQAKQMMIDEIRAKGGLGGMTSKPGG